MCPPTFILIFCLSPSSPSSHLHPDLVPQLLHPARKQLQRDSQLQGLTGRSILPLRRPLHARIAQHCVQQRSNTLQKGGGRVGVGTVLIGGGEGTSGEGVG